MIESNKVKPSKFYQLLLDEAAGAPENDSDTEPTEAAEDGDVRSLTAAPFRSIPAVCSNSVRTVSHLQEAMQDAASADEELSPLESAAAELDTATGPAFFTDFFKCILHPRSVIQVPLLGPLQPPAGFGDITADEHTHRQV